MKSVYLSHWKLSRLPFDERINPSWFFGSVHHQGLRAKLTDVIRRRSAVAVVAGECGVGKSTVAATLVEDLSAASHPVVQVSPTPTKSQAALQEILTELENRALNTSHVSTAAELDAAIVVEKLQAILALYSQSGKHPVALLDAADGMPEGELVALVRTLRGLSCDPRSSLTTILIGSAELLVRTRRVFQISDESFPQCILGAMAPADTAGYVGHRLRLANGDPFIFTPAAIELIHDLSGGVPRRVNRLCDLCLLIGFGGDALRITENHVWTAQDELRVLSPTRTAVAPMTQRWRPLRRRHGQAIEN